MASRRRTWLAGATAVLAAVALTGCSGSAVSGGGGGGGAADKTIKIGMSSILSGPAASAGTGTDAGTKAYLETLNEKGGVNGYTFTFDEQDNEYDAAKSATVARSLVNNGADLIVTQGTAQLAATAPVVGDLPILTLSDGGLLAPPTKYPNTFGINPDYRREAAYGADFILKKLNQKTAGLVYLNTATGTPARDAFPARFTAGGGQVVASEAVAQGSTDYSPFVQKLKQSGAPVVYAFLLDTQMAGLQKAADAIGYKPIWVTWFTPYNPAYLKLAGGLATGTYVSLFQTPLSDSADPEVGKFLTAMKKYGPDQIDNPTAQQGWTFGAIIEKGVTLATADGKEFTTANFVTALKTIQGQRMGFVSSLTYNDQTHAGATAAGFYSIQADGSVKLEQPSTEFPMPAAP